MQQVRSFWGLLDTFQILLLSAFSLSNLNDRRKSLEVLSLRASSTAPFCLGGGRRGRGGLADTRAWQGCDTFV